MFGPGGAVRRPDARHDTSNSAISGKNGPPSPTLTNPDMILPDYDDMGYLDDSTQSPLLTWNGTHFANPDFQMPQQTALFNGGPLTPSTPIIYGNGTMLSDIGEVTEVESNAGGPVSRGGSVRHSIRNEDGAPLRSSPTVGAKSIKKLTHRVNRERRPSIESTSTINNQDHADAFADFDDAASACDSNFQGDDEESLASSLVHDGPTNFRPPRHAGRSSDQSDNTDRYSTTSISRRAEQILANAKMRLTTMEGNLSRARTLSYSSISDGSTPSPPINRSATAFSLHAAPLPVTSNHARNISENGLPGPAKISPYPQRSASALGAAGGYRQPPQPSRSADIINGRASLPSHKSPHHARDTALEPLSEDVDDTVGSGSSPGSKLSSSFASPTFSTYSDAGMNRSVSVAQVRDLQDQMSGLKGKISSLRDQARADSMKRRSLQSLRTPSPFTHSQWDQRPSESNSIHSPEPEPEPAGVALEHSLDDDATGDFRVVNHEDGAPPSPEDGATPTPDDEDDDDDAEADDDDDDDDGDSVVSGYYEAQEAQVHPRSSAKLQELGAYDVAIDPAYEEEEEQDDLRTENGDFHDAGDGEESVVDFASESGDSLYHDSLQHTVSHEDREDAFDYEHFFLHSAMGSLSRQSTRRGSSESEHSEDSVETTRGPTRIRRPSVDTTASEDTFATAREGLVSRSSTIRSTRDDMESTSDEESDQVGTGSSSDETGFSRDKHRRQISVLHRPISTSSASTLHRPSVSSFESTGTNRSFPLVNKSRLSGGVLTPSGSSPDQDLRRIRDSLLSDTTSVVERESGNSDGSSPAMQTLSREDQLSVELIVASLGKCVLGLSQGPQNADGQQALRKRLDAARRILEGESESAGGGAGE